MMMGDGGRPRAMDPTIPKLGEERYDETHVYRLSPYAQLQRYHRPARFCAWSSLTLCLFHTSVWPIVSLCRSGLLKVGVPKTWNDSKQDLGYIRKAGVRQFISTYNRVRDLKGDELLWVRSTRHDGLHGQFCQADGLGSLDDSQ